MEFFQKHMGLLVVLALATVTWFVLDALDGSENNEPTGTTETEPAITAGA